MLSRLVRQTAIFMLSVLTSFLVGWLMRERLERLYQAEQAEPAAPNPKPSQSPPTSAAPPTSASVESLAPAPKPRSRRKDDLTLINGIGPAYERALNAAGIRTFAELAAQNAEDLLGKLQIRASVERIGNWIEEAKQRSKQ